MRTHKKMQTQQQISIWMIHSNWILCVLLLLIIFMPVTVLSEMQTPSTTNPHEVYPSESTMPKGIIGLALNISSHRVGDPAGLFIQAVHPEGPAAKAGLAHGDEITAVDGISLTGKTYEQVVRMIRGEIGQPVTLNVKGNQGSREVSLQRLSEEELMGKKKT